MSKIQVAWFRKNISINEIQLRNFICKLSSKGITKPKVQNLWNDLTESYSCNIFLAFSAITTVKCPSINFCFEFLERSRTFYWVWYKIWQFGSKRIKNLSSDKQYDLVFFLMHNSFLDYQVFPQNDIYHSSIQATPHF